MKTRVTVIALGALFALGPASPGRAQAPPPTAPKTLAATVGVYVFPAAGQTPERQSTDEAQCYDWAVDNTGVDPFEAQKVSQQQAQQAAAAQQQAAQTGQGRGARGAVIGAATGALIGEIADDKPGEGAAVGTAVGLIAGRRRGKAASAQAQQDVAQQAAQAQAFTAQQVDGFKKAFAACLEAKQYVVKI